jgi:CRP/FNR family transcriptional regulator, anaerobic regulatory protein
MRGSLSSTRPNIRVAADQWGEPHSAAAAHPHREPRAHQPAIVLGNDNRGHIPWVVCKLQEGLDANTIRQIDESVSVRHRLNKGETLYHVGDPFISLHVIRSGSCKTVSLSEDGHDQVSGYYMVGEIIGTDGIGAGCYGSQSVALEDTETCALPFERLEALGRQNIAFQHSLHRLLSGEIARGRSVMVLLGTMNAEQRLAAFLLDLSQRYKTRGYSCSEFVLRLTREEIGSYLGLKLETVSRLFSRLHRCGLIQIEGRVVKLLDRKSLEQLIACSE